MEPHSLSSIGLLLAAILSLVNVFGGVCKKKALDRQELFAASFWIRFFAALGFTAILAVAMLSGSGPSLHFSAVIKKGQLQQIPLLAERLRHPQNQAVEQIASSFSAPTQALLNHFQANRDDPALAFALQRDLNARYLKGGSLFYDPALFSGVVLSAETERVLASHPQGSMAAYANRLLLQELFPGNFTRNPGSDLFGIRTWIVPPAVAFAVYTLVISLLLATSQLLANYALQVSPISMSLPFMAFSPLFLMGTSFVVLHEMPTANKVMGVVLIILGGLLMHRQHFAVSWQAPLRALVKEPGSRYMLLAALVVSITAPVEKKLLVLSDWQTVGFCYGLGTLLIYAILCLAMRTKLSGVLGKAPAWTIAAGLIDTATVLLQYAAVVFLPVVIVICIKRSGVVLIILAGWLIFHEKGVRDKLLAAAAMTAGVTIFYLDINTRQALLVSLTALVCLALALRWTRTAHRTAQVS